MTQQEIDMLLTVANPDSTEAIMFWATAQTVAVLSDWGVSFSVWFHSCSCSHQESDKEAKQCRLKGRRSIELACGAWAEFVNQLHSLNLSRDAMKALSTLENHENGYKEYAQFLVRSFQDCKAAMELRARQSFSFWSTMPFSMLELCRHHIDSTCDETWSRHRALELMNLFDTTEDKTSLGVISWFFFGNQSNRSHMEMWSSLGVQLEDSLQQLLLGYSLSLTCMQRLEGRHHLVHMAVARGRALKPAGLMASLRRKQNGDVHHEKFRELLPELLNGFDLLVPQQQWASRRQLLDIIYGSGLDQLHPDMTVAEQQMARHVELSEQLVQQRGPPSRTVPCQHEVFYASARTGGVVRSADAVCTDLCAAWVKDMSTHTPFQGHHSVRTLAKGIRRLRSHRCYLCDASSKIRRQWQCVRRVHSVQSCFFASRPEKLSSAVLCVVKR